MSQLSLFGNEESEKSRSSQEGFPVSRIVLPASVERLLMSVISGENLPGSFARLGQDGCWLKTCQGYLVPRMDGSLVEFSETWPRWGIMRDGVCMELAPLVRPIDENESLLWPTPTANCHQNPGEHGQGGQNLVTEVYRDAGEIPTTGQLNPEFVECLMGLPIGFTSINGLLDQGNHNTSGSRQE